MPAPGQGERTSARYARPRKCTTCPVQWMQRGRSGMRVPNEKMSGRVKSEIQKPQAILQVEGWNFSETGFP